MDAKSLRDDFPIFRNHPQIIYFDNACTTFKPMQVIDAISAYYSEYCACAGRSNHALSRKTSEQFEMAREEVAKFVGAKESQVAWVRNTSEAINSVANGLDFSKRKKVVTTDLEHHSALLPFMRLEKEGKIKLEFVNSTQEGALPLEQFQEAIGRDTSLVVTHSVNNTCGTSPPLEAIIKIAHDNGAKVLIDGAQGIAHLPFNFSNSNADFLAFSAHKMCGPTGIGCLVGKEEALLELRPQNLGGETISEATLRGYKLLPPPKRFEAGIQNYAGAIGLAQACKYLSKVGMENIHSHEKELAKFLHEQMSESSFAGKLEIIGPKNPDLRTSAIYAFNIKGLSAHQVSITLDKIGNIAVRSGLFCAQPAMETLGAKQGAVRASLYLYNTKEEIEKFVQTLEKVAQLS